jgi:hypothetical protein
VEVSFKPKTIKENSTPELQILKITKDGKPKP